MGEREGHLKKRKRKTVRSRLRVNFLEKIVVFPGKLLDFPGMREEEMEKGKGKEKVTLPDYLRCKRTDGRRWRCNRRVMEDKKLCEVHYMQGKHRQHREKVPESLKLQRSNKRKEVKVDESSEIRARSRKLRRLRMKRKKEKEKEKEKEKKKERVLGESEALDEVVKKMKLKRGDLQLELIRMVLKREVEKRETKKRKTHHSDDDEDGVNCSDTCSDDDDTDTEFTRQLPNGFMAVSSVCSGANSDNAGTSSGVKVGAEQPVVVRRRFRSKNIEPTPVGAVQVVTLFACCFLLRYVVVFGFIYGRSMCLL